MSKTVLKKGMIKDIDAEKWTREFNFKGMMFVVEVIVLSTPWKATKNTEISSELLIYSKNERIVHLQEFYQEKLSDSQFRKAVKKAPHMMTELIDKIVGRYDEIRRIDEQ